ncbi:hypothetical protein [Novosphingobium soli]|uniref:hypothetical protein n=1 Tax=Novosphingobium soli TaxID=574956 RepID=UPI0036D35F84
MNDGESPRRSERANGREGRESQAERHSTRLRAITATIATTAIAGNAASPYRSRRDNNRRGA